MTGMWGKLYLRKSCFGALSAFAMLVGLFAFSHDGAPGSGNMMENIDGSRYKHVHVKLWER